jgi:hypothetical protein
MGKWLDGVTDIPGTPPEVAEMIGIKSGNRLLVKVAAAGAWKDDKTFQMESSCFQTPHHDTVTCRYEGTGVDIGFLNIITQPRNEFYPSLPPSHSETRPVLKERIST